MHNECQYVANKKFLKAGIIAGIKHVVSSAQTFGSVNQNIFVHVGYG